LTIVIYLLFKGFSRFVNLLPEGFSLWMGRQMGFFAFHLVRDRRQIALQNLHIAFGQEKSEDEIRVLAKKAFQNLGMTAIEFFRIPKMDAEDFKEKVQIEGLDQALKVLERKKGALLLLSHFGNWELMGIMSKVLNNPILVIAKPMKGNPRVDRLITEIRESAGLEVISTENASRKVIRAISQKRIVGILIDQRAKRSEGVWADFFGKKAPTTPGLAVLAMKTHAPVLPVFMVRNGFFKHRLLIKEPLELIDSGDIKKDVESNTRLFNQVIESMIRQYPDQWFWVHRRWERKQRVHRR
jgi:KDO2-lipid IV(A) lauroyltransferase